MTRAVVCAPLSVERVVLRGVRAEVIRSGMGPARSRRTAARITGRPRLVAGVGGGLASFVRPGDVVVASSVSNGSSAVACSAAALASAIEELGFTVHVGPIVSTDRIAHGDARSALAATGALAVDMESFWLAPIDDPGDEPFAVVRVITDTVDAPLIGPGALPRGLRALRTLARITPAFNAWIDNLQVTLFKEVS
jgi:4-hydroxy-3-methylbut-2-enyl diphosphate reductase